MIKVSHVLMITCTSVLFSTNVVAAGDAEAGKAKAAVCAGCHGINGISSNEIWPNLAGQKEAYLANQIKAFRDGIREDPTMKPMVMNLTDQDAEDLAAYYAQLK